MDYGKMNGNEQIIIRVGGSGRYYTWWTSSQNYDADNNSIPDQATVNNTTSASTLATAIQNALPTLET